MLIVYVDDILLAGPKDHHAEFWRKLRLKVNTEDPEPMDRFLGRHHTFTPCDALDYNLLDFYVSKIKLLFSSLNTHPHLLASQCSMDNKYLFRRSLYALRDLSKGITLSCDDITALRPLDGIPVEFLDDIISGSFVLSQSVSKGHPIKWSDVTNACS